MSRNTVPNTITGLASPPSRANNSSLPAGESLALKNPYILHEHIPNQTSHTKRHHRESSRLGPGSAGGSGKDGRSRKSGHGGGDQEETDSSSDSSSSQDDEETDDDEDADDADEPAVNRPVRVTGEDATSMKLFPDDQSTVQNGGQESIVANGDHRAGRGSKKRSFDADIDELTENGPEQNHPNKKVAFDIAKTDDLLEFSDALFGPISDDISDIGSFTDGDFGLIEDDEGGVLIDIDEEEDIDAGDDEDIEGEEEDAIFRELENGIPSSTPVKASPFLPSDITPEILNGLDLGNVEEFEDLNDEMFISQWNDPTFFPDIPCDPVGDYYLFNDGDIFSANPTPDSTPAITPDNTPRGSFSATAPSMPISPTARGNLPSPTAGSDEESSDEDEVPTLNPFFEKKDPAVKHLVSIQGRGGWADDTDDDVDVPWKHFFSSDGSSNGGDDGEEDAADSESEDESDSGETTDEDEDLPMPTPRGKSILRRVSMSSQEPESPQVVHIDGASRPRLGSWVADPNRPICVVEGSKKTFLVPKGKQVPVDETNDNGNVSNFLVMMAEESESENSAGFLDYNPTLSGLTGGDGIFLNGADILGPPEAFYPYFNEEDEFIADGLGDEELDEYEADLKIADFLELSSDEDDNEHTENDFGTGNLELALMDGACDEPDADDECIPSAELPAQMLSRWDKVSVTAFRKRQTQHAQKMANLHGNPNSSPTAGYGLQKKLGETITPTRKKKVKRRLMAGNRGLGASAAMRKKISNRKAEELGRNFGSASRIPPIFESM
ncbi:hypothetical protein L873DRAFT_1831049 [Choiromyces venosus 120613-1]|uniref:Uncharacterized protein n=1 Tax=Choiromyces venosus 120613-1 TaxID=1336337 RepID=A0A3N4J2T8_9PEZI|nr:hypothetical protein L873DRAFT_1831049 [Choiromyces venosus 120613-1]